MMLNREELKDVVDAKNYGGHYVYLTVGDIEQFKSGIEVSGGTSNFDVATEPTRMNGIWKLPEGAYHVYFNERLNGLTKDDVAFILPSPNALRVGVEASQRMVHDDKLWSLLRVSKHTDIAKDSVLGLLVVYRNRSNLSPEDVQDIVSEQVSKQVERNESE